MNVLNATVSEFNTRIVVRAQCENATEYAQLCDFAKTLDQDGKLMIVAAKFPDDLYAKAYDAVKQFYRTDCILKEVATMPFPALDMAELMTYAPLNLDLHLEISKTLKGQHAASAILYADRVAS